MALRVLILSVLVALGHSKAIVTNKCRKDVYIWSVPEKADLANNLSISPGKRYEEPWRSGTTVIPGVAIKISTERDGIYTGKGEINFQYDVDSSDANKIWIDLATVRGNDFDTATLNTCRGSFKSSDVPTQQCSSTDDIELVLCGSERTVPSLDTTPVRVISNCIGLLAERDDPLHPRMCSARVVGPKRMPMLSEDEESQWLVERVDTVPLKTVMRLEAAKHAASQDAEAHTAPRARNTGAVKADTVMENSVSSGPMCNLLHEAWPDAQCDEKMAQHNAKLFYQDNCGEKTKYMFPGASCEAIRHQMEQIYPGVVEKRDNHVTMCINKYYPWFEKFWGSRDTVKSVLNNHGDPLFPDRSWTSDEELCQKPNKTVSPVLKDGKHRFKRCVKPFCHKGYRLPGDCSDVEDELEKLSKDAGWEVDWTSEDEVCGDKRAATEKRDVNATPPTKHGHRITCVEPAYKLLRHFPPWGSKRAVKEFLNNGGPYNLFHDVSFTSDEEQCRGLDNPIDLVKPIGNQPCVRPWCDHGSCSELRDALNVVSRQAGKDVSWTTDDSADLGDEHCQYDGSALTRRQIGNATYGIGHRWNDIRKVCITTANEKLGKYWGANETEERVRELFSGVRWTTNLDDCSPQAIAESRAYHRKLIDKKQHKEKKCVVGCQGKACKRVKKELNMLSTDVGQNWSWTDDEKVCTSNVTFGSQGPEVSRCVVGENAIRKLFTYWGDVHDDVMREIYPNIDWTTDEECDLPYDMAARKWLRDHRVKGKRPQRCVNPYCKPFEADCSDVEDQLEEISKNLGHEIDWTTDDDACPKVAPDVFVAYPSEVCMLENCRIHNLSNDECEEAAELAEELSLEFFGTRVSFSVDGPACLGVRANELPHLPLSTKAKRGSHKVCRKELCRRSDHIDYDCKKIEHNLGRFLNKTMQMDVEFTDDHDVCGIVLARTSFEDPTISAYNTSMSLVCSKAYCAPRIPGVDCAVVHRDFGMMFQIEAVPPTVGDATSDHVCRDEPFLRLPVVRDQSRRQKVCVRDLCTLSESKYGKKCDAVVPLIERYYRGAHDVDIAASIDDDVCGKETGH
ncbi:uncharacterized protein N0V89_001243 [Didymosphaeria variabile]|uniref:Uncharacterized protein n=1 Tax=Didymosphaeria variabile TaxID=1932322 RepID=A0A9W8XWM9_9PLEO|nr:uncharacterized protein N0V89_001243 [Didymosphaeria variabile]KAJ4360676.1 hypothetical protein N0V89_001243 [Didymosphaeria variabile]